MKVKSLKNMCIDKLKKMFSSKRTPVDYSEYVELFYLYGGGSMKAIRHDAIAQILNIDASWLHQHLIDNYHAYFWLYVYWEGGTWRKYMQNFTLNMNMQYFVAIDKTNIGVLKKIYENDAERLQRLNDIEIALI